MQWFDDIFDSIAIGLCHDGAWPVIDVSEPLSFQAGISQSGYNGLAMSALAKSCTK